MLGASLLCVRGWQPGAQHLDAAASCECFWKASIGRPHGSHVLALLLQDDLERVRVAGKGRVDITVGSALDIFGGKLPYTDVAAWHKQQQQQQQQQEGSV